MTKQLEAKVHLIPIGYPKVTLEVGEYDDTK